jgi:hypothetical protein
MHATRKGGVMAVPNNSSNAPNRKNKKLQTERPADHGKVFFSWFTGWLGSSSANRITSIEEKT